MNNKDVVDAFYNKKCAKTKNLQSIGNTLVSYNTTIAQRINLDDINVVIKNTTRYSQSTSKHQSLITKYNFVAEKVPVGVTNLRKYIVSDL